MQILFAKPLLRIRLLIANTKNPVYWCILPSKYPGHATRAPPLSRGGRVWTGDQTMASPMPWPLGHDILIKHLIIIEGLVKALSYWFGCVQLPERKVRPEQRCTSVAKLFSCFNYSFNKAPKDSVTVCMEITRICLLFSPPRRQKADHCLSSAQTKLRCPY